MPKYFTKKKALPYQVVRLKASAIDSSSIDEVFSKTNPVSLSIVHDGLHASSLGYLVHINKSDAGYLISNITGENEIGATNTASLCVILKHVCGQEYSNDVKQIFQRNRNKIGITRRPDFFTATT